MLNRNRSIVYTTSRAEDIVIDNIPKNTQALLDYGSGDGHFTKKLINKAKKIYACDVDKKTFSLNPKNYLKVDFSTVGVHCVTDYPDNSFDCITLMGVLEHVDNELILLKELSRILKPEGVLMVYVLNKGLLGFIDAANLKFIFPGLHKFIWEIVYSKESYKEEFIDKTKKNMFGDFTYTKKWHSHYSITELDKMANSFSLKREKVWYYGMFSPLLMLIEFVYYVIFKRFNPFISWLLKSDSSISFGTLSYSMVASYKKVKN